MLRYFATVLTAVFIALGVTYCAARADWKPADMNRQVDQTNFLVNNNCSATLIDAAHGYLLTANHCIADQFDTIEREKVGDDGTVTKERVRVAKPGTVSQLFYAGPNVVQRTSYAFKIKQNDAPTDLALIQVRAKLTNTDSAPIACSEPERGETVYAVGNSLGVLYATVSKGIVSSVHRDYRTIGVDDNNADNGLVQATTPIAGGNSGGALYNDRGELVGVNVRGYQSVSPIALAVPLSDVKTFLGREKLDGLWARCAK